MERELGWLGGHARRGPEPETVIYLPSHARCSAQSIDWRLALCADGRYASDLAMPRFTKDDTRSKERHHPANLPGPIG